MSTTSVSKHLITGRTQNLEVFLEVFLFLRSLPFLATLYQMRKTRIDLCDCTHTHM